MDWTDKEARNAYYRDYAKKRYRRQRQAAIEFLGGKCVACGATEKLQFDHSATGHKQKHIADVVGRWNIGRVFQLLEDEKVRLLCATCHWKRHS